MINTINNVKDPNVALIAVLDKLVRISPHPNFHFTNTLVSLLELPNNNKKLHGRTRPIINKRQGQGK